MLPVTHRLLPLLLLAATALRAALPLQPERSSPLDLELCGRLDGLSAGSTEFVRWEDLRALPTREIDLPDEFGKGPRKARILFLSDLLAALPQLPDADCLLATCKDGYASVYTHAFIQAYRPFLVLELDGLGPSRWPPPGLKYSPAPYAITVAYALVPEARSILDIGHKKPWGVIRLEVARFDLAFRGAFQGAWEHPTPGAAAGRTLWINSCASCHPGPEGTFGGTKSGMPFPAVTAIAAFAAPTFRQYVRDPRSVSASAKMEAHPHYSDAQLDQLIAFITAGTAR